MENSFTTVYYDLWTTIQQVIGSWQSFHRRVYNIILGTATKIIYILYIIHV